MSKQPGGGLNCITMVCITAWVPSSHTIIVFPACVTVSLPLCVSVFPYSPRIIVFQANMCVYIDVCCVHEGPQSFVQLGFNMRLCARSLFNGTITVYVR